MVSLRQQPKMIVHQKYPLNAGPSLDLLRAEYITPQEHFFVRTHGTIPEVDSMSYRLVISGKVQRQVELSLDELRNDFPITTVTAVLQCAGARRNELTAIGPIAGEVPWGAEAISNAVWRGVPLEAVLRRAGVTAEAQHVAFSGLDCVQKGDERFHFGGSIPLDKALSSEVLLAYEMNGEALTATHGFPLRVIVPGYIGARSVKWLSEIVLQEHPSSNYFQAHAYKLFPPHIQSSTADWNAGQMLGELSLNAVICQPQDGACLPCGPTTVQGFAITSGGHTIECIELSLDEGATWQQARIIGGQDPWAWCFWETELTLPRGQHQLIARAWDSSAYAQPQELCQVWNFKGYMNNAWHRVNVVAVP